MVRGTTKTAQVINPEVMADMVSSKLPEMIKFAPLAYVEKELVGVPGDTLTVPKWTYSGDATDIEEGEAIPVDQIGTKKQTMTIKQTGKAVEITDKAALTAHGDIYTEAANQITLAIANKVDNDIITAAKTATQNITEAPISVANIDKALAIFNDEDDAKYVALVNPKDAIKLRADAGQNWLRGSEIGADIIISGTFGEVAGVQIVRAKKVEEGKGYLVKISSTNTDTDDNAKYGAFVINLKRDIEVEKDRDILKKTTVFSGDEYYGVYLYDDTKVVKFGGA
jgi:phage capsid family|nr:MAG TPA: major capsid protein [Caudoviricetes sp.]